MRWMTHLSPAPHQQQQHLNFPPGWSTKEAQQEQQALLSAQIQSLHDLTMEVARERDRSLRHKEDLENAKVCDDDTIDFLISLGGNESVQGERIKASKARATEAEHVVDQLLDICSNNGGNNATCADSTPAASPGSGT